jgi:hypothetical protein
MVEYGMDLKRKHRLEQEFADEAHVHKGRVIASFDQGTISPLDENKVVVDHEAGCESILKAGDEICDCDPDIYIANRAVGEGRPTELQIDANGDPI